MNDNTYKFMIKTGKYLPDENIQYNTHGMFFDRCNEQGEEIYYEDSDGEWIKRDYDEQGKEIYFETSKCYWEKKEYNPEGIMIYSENSLYGVTRDER